jgi:metal-responsive CopG/Arc/MetJ family transcriptional regulator
MGFGLIKTNTQNIELLFPLNMVRIEIHLDKTETNILDAIAKEDGRSRKNLCETQVRKLIKERGQKIKTSNENVDTKK